MTDHVPVKIPNTDASLTLSDLSPTIAAELAAELSSPETIRKRYGLSEAHWKMLSKNTVFREMLKESIRRLRGDMNAGNRITLKAEVLLEDAMPELYHIVKSETSPASEKVNAIKQLADLAGRNSKKEQAVGGGGGGFVLNINLTKEQGVTINGTKVESSDENS